MASFLFFLGVLPCCLVPLVAAQSISQVPPNYSCARFGYIVVPLAGGLFPGFYCTEDPCLGEDPPIPSACGPGNTCTTRAASFPGNNYLYLPDCQCQAPYVPATVTIGQYANITTCYIPGQDACRPDPCRNGGLCRTAGTAPDGTPVYVSCFCLPPGRGGGTAGRFCQNRILGPVVLATVDGVTGPLAQAVGGFEIDQYCGNTPFPFGCQSFDLSKYVCCSVGCGPNVPGEDMPRCLGERFVPQPNDYIPSLSIPDTPQDQGVCGGGGYALDYPVRCFLKDDANRYICCDAEGCDGYNADGVTPQCKNSGYVPPGYGAFGVVPLDSSTTSPTATTGPPVATTAQPTSAPVSPTNTPVATTAQPTSAPLSPTNTPVATTAEPTSAPVLPRNTPAPPTSAPEPTTAPAPARAPKTLVTPSTSCPPVDGFYTNSCFNSDGSMHVCCLNPDSCGPLDENDNPTCTNGRYYVFN